MASPLLSLPAETLLQLSSYLPAPDVLSFVSSHSVLHRSCGQSPTFWKSLIRAQCPTSRLSLSEANSREADDELSYVDAKESYVLHAHCNEVSTVRWGSVLSRTTPSAREGHVCCQIGYFVVLTGGFTDDNTVYVKDIRVTTSSWQRVQVVGEVEIEWVYGATLTTLDNSRAIRFGGFQSGGYSDEACQVALLHFNSADMTARWEVVECKQADGSVVNGESYAAWSNFAARAYHTATLLSARYLCILGGMQSGGSILNPMLLDCHTWTWRVDGIATHAEKDGVPSPRHGCSVVYDCFRNRLVVLGGGCGSDLLRSGCDNTEVWALHLNGFDASSKSAQNNDLPSSLPWTWQCVHTDQTDEAENADAQGGLHLDPNRLSPVERLNLGRCHSAFRIGRDAALLLFGSGRPSATNSVLGYCLSKDEFVRPVVSGPFLPRARFTFASVFVEERGYIVAHGGFSNQDTSGALSDTVILDLAPNMPSRPLLHWNMNARAVSFPALTTDEVLEARDHGSSHSMMQQILGTLMQSDQADRPSAAAQIIANYQGTRRLEGRFEMMLHLIASGRVELTEDGNIREAANRND